MALASHADGQYRRSPNGQAHPDRFISERTEMVDHHKLLEPSRKLRHLRKLGFKRHPGAIKHDLMEIEREVISLEIQNADLRRINLELVHRANEGREDVEIPF